MRTEYLEVNGIKHLIKINYEDRNNATVSLGKKAINIRIPSFLDREEKFRQLMRMKIWVRNKLMENPEKFKPEQQKIYSNGKILKVGNDKYSLRIDYKDKQSSSARIIGNIIQLYISNNISKEMENKHVSTLLSRCIARKRLHKLQEKITELNNLHFNQKLSKIFFKHNKSNWGSCSEAGNINISTRLLFAPDEVLEYVCIHELAHLSEPNHSNNFWTLVEKAMPDYKEKVKWLKENGNMCRF